MRDLFIKHYYKVSVPVFVIFMTLIIVGHSTKLEWMIWLGVAILLAWGAWAGIFITKVRRGR